MTLKLGKLPARPGAVALRFADVFNAVALPTPPAVFGHQALVPRDWGMLANDQWGCCVFSGGEHEEMLWAREGGLPSPIFTDDCTVADYSAVTGFSPSDPSTDQGTDMQEAASYRRKVGLVDASGVRHRVDAYTALPVGRVDILALASYVTGAAGIGVLLTDANEDQFNRGVPWDVVPGARQIGGHYVPLVGRVASGNYVVVSWGREQEVTPPFLEQQNDEGIAYLSLDILSRSTKVSPEGYNSDLLNEYLRSL